MNYMQFAIPSSLNAAAPMVLSCLMMVALVLHMVKLQHLMLQDSLGRLPMFDDKMSELKFWLEQALYPLLFTIALFIIALRLNPDLIVINLGLQVSGVTQ